MYPVEVIFVNTLFPVRCIMKVLFLEMQGNDMTMIHLFVTINIASVLIWILM